MLQQTGFLWGHYVMSRKGFKLNYQVTCTITKEKNRITGEQWVWEYASACYTLAAGEVIQIQWDVIGDRLMLQTSDLELTGCKTYSCLDLTFWSRPVFSSTREDHSAILCTGTDSPRWVFLSPCIFRPLHQEPLFWGWSFVPQGHKREILALSSPTVQGWEGWKHSRWTHTA